MSQNSRRATADITWILWLEYSIKYCTWVCFVNYQRLKRLGAFESSNTNIFNPRSATHFTIVLSWCHRGISLYRRWLEGVNSRESRLCLCCFFLIVPQEELNSCSAQDWKVIVSGKQDSDGGMTSYWAIFGVRLTKYIPWELGGMLWFSTRNWAPLFKLVSIFLEAGE